MNIEARNGRFRGGRVPKAQTLNGYNQPYYDQPEDTEPFTNNQPGPLTLRKPGIVRTAPNPAGSRPLRKRTRLPRQGGSWITGIRKAKSADQLDRYFDTTS